MFMSMTMEIPILPFFKCNLRKLRFLLKNITRFRHTDRKATDHLMVGHEWY
jgi:hypothetical protein